MSMTSFIAVGVCRHDASSRGLWGRVGGDSELDGPYDGDLGVNTGSPESSRCFVSSGPLRSIVGTIEVECMSNTKFDERWC